MNINGNEGPTLKKIFTCEGCKYLGKSVLWELGRKPYKCFYYDKGTGNIRDLKLIDGDIDSSKITPDFCPVLLQANRCEKLKEISGIKEC